MTPGEVIFWPQKQHDDGSRSDKLMIALCAQRNGRQLLVYTTSQARPWFPDKNKEGCHASKELYLIKEKTYGFTKTTYVQLSRVQEWDVDGLEDRLIRNKCRCLKTVVPAAIVQAIVNCYRATDSYAGYHEFYLTPGNP